MAYNDIWSYKGIFYGITCSKYYSSVSKSFCDAYDENENSLYAPLRLKRQVSSQILLFWINQILMILWRIGRFIPQF